MSGRGLVLALLGAGGAYLLLRDLGGPGQQGQVVYVQQPAGAGGGDKVAVLGKFVEWIGGKVGGGGGGAGSPGQGVLIDRLPDLVAPQVAGAGRGLRPLLDLIGRAEAPRGYDQYFGGIRPEHAPPRPLTHLTVKQVLDWQDSIDRYLHFRGGGALSGDGRYLARLGAGPGEPLGAVQCGNAGWYCRSADGTPWAEPLPGWAAECRGLREQPGQGMGRIAGCQRSQEGGAATMMATGSTAPRCRCPR